MITIYGTPLCPYTRRVLILSAEVGVQATLVDTRTAEGEAELLNHHPLGRTPVTVIGDLVLFGDRAACTEILMQNGRPLARPGGQGRLRKVTREFWQDANLMDVIDAVTDAALDRYRLQREGLSIRSKTLLDLQDRMVKGIAWLEPRINGNFFQIYPESGFGNAEIALITMIDAIRWHNLLPIPEDSVLGRFRSFHQNRLSVVDAGISP